MKFAQHITLPDHRPIIPVRWQDGDLVCKFGKIAAWNPAQHLVHQPRSGNHGVVPCRVCIHRAEPMPPAQLFGTDWLSQFHWQTTVEPRCGVIISRSIDTVTLAFDVIGPVNGCEHIPNGEPPVHRWRYTLYRLRWEDETDPAPSLLLGVTDDYL
jgi:hypothetical protein